jgi:hypothetical protein
MSLGEQYDNIIMGEEKWGNPERQRRRKFHRILKLQDKKNKKGANKSKKSA